MIQLDFNRPQFQVMERVDVFHFTITCLAERLTD
jgi:hypothetical protein